uniref:Non-SMC condensin II complex subunit D3 n=1 Tax=Chrysolophus pictus TaxID=9089 RepID=A0A8C3KXK1_CHRPC
RSPICPMNSTLMPWCSSRLLGLWVSTVWDLDFTETEPLDPRIEEEITEDGLGAFSSLYQALTPFATGDDKSRGNIWRLFVENNLSRNALVAVWHHFVQTGLNKRANAQQRVYALHAAGLYFLLLEIPGSIAHQMFHDVMFDKCLQTLTKCWPQGQNLMRKRKKVHAESSQTNARRNRRKGMMEEVFEEEEEEDLEDVYFSTDDLLQIRKAIFLLLKNFLRLLPKFSLKEKPQCFQNCLYLCLPLFRNITHAKYVPELAYHGLWLLCSPLHGTENEINLFLICYLVLLACIPNKLMLAFDLQVFTNILKHKAIPCTAEDLSTLQDRCRDPAVSVRKQALQSVTELLEAQHNDVQVHKVWLTGVVPVVMDSESSVQEKALECLDQILLQHIKHYNKFRREDTKQVLAWDLLTLLTSESQELSCYMNKAFHIWSRQNKFSSTFINNVMSHVETEHAVPAWMLLAKVASSSPKLDYSKVIESWYTVSRQQNTSNDTTGHVLSVISHVAKHLPRSTCERLIDNIKHWLKEFQCPLEVISPAVESLQKLCCAYAGVPKKTQELLNQVFGDLISTCESYISNIVLKEDGAEQLQEDLLVRHLFLLGEAAQLCPAKVEKRIFLLIQSILASSDHLPDGEEIPASQPLSQFRGSAMPPVIRAHAFITLGKLCLQHEDLAKKCIAALARELEVSHDVAVRNNVVIVMCDLCIRYTTMVDRYIPNISLCLKDPHPFIRKQTLILITNLLQEEFVKWKDCLFFRFISVLVDPNPDIARFAEFCLVHLLLKRNPVMFSQHFIECIFHFNSYEKHEKYNRFPQSERAKTLFSLRGKDNKEKRMHIYKFLLDHFTDEQRFSITTKISHSVLACFVDGVLPLDMEASELLSDTFAILSCKEIKLSTMRSKPDEDIQPDEDEMAMANAVMQAAQKKLISQVQKRNFIENIIPIITELKSLMERKKIPALRDLMNYLREMMQDYRNEIKEFFAVDKQLAAELEYDMKKYEEQLDKEKSDQEHISSPQAEVGGAVNSVFINVKSSLSLVPEIVRGWEGAGLSLMSCISSGFAAISHFNVTVCLLSCRPASLSTLAILNSAWKAVEARSKPMRSLNISILIFLLYVASFQSVNQLSTGARSPVGGRAISTPEQTINDLTFGAGVSYISLTHTPGSAQENKEAEEQPGDIICLTSPEKLPSVPREWKVESPARRKSSRSVPLRQSRWRTPLKTEN